MKLLLRRKEVNPDTQAKENGQTPLLLAALNGHEGIIRLLLEQKDVNPDIPDLADGVTGLSWAAEKGHEGIV